MARTPVYRRYKIVQYHKGSNHYMQLVVQFTDPQGVWRTHAVRSYGQVTFEATRQAASDLNELEQYAANPNDPIPIGPVNEAIWRNYQKVCQEGLPSPLDPSGTLEAVQGAASDIAHLIGWIIADATGDVATKVNITQPQMGATEKQQFIMWLQNFPSSAQRKLLAYQWQYV